MKKTLKYTIYEYCVFQRFLYTEELGYTHETSVLLDNFLILFTQISTQSSTERISCLLNVLLLISMNCCFLTLLRGFLNINAFSYFFQSFGNESLFV